MDNRGLALLLAWLRDAPPGTTVAAAEIAKRLANVAPNGAGVSSDGPTPTWRERLWTVPPETRIGRQELLEALGRSRNWLYRHTGKKATCARIPCRKLDGELVFVVGEVRRWLVDHEEIVEPGRSAPLVVPMRRQA